MELECSQWIAPATLETSKSGLFRRRHRHPNHAVVSLSCRCCSAVYVGEDEGQILSPPRGTRVDSISYYTRDLANANTILLQLQQKMEKVAESGNAQGNALLDMLLRYATDTADQILEDSLEDNDLTSPSDSYDNLAGLASQTPYIAFKEDTPGAAFAYQYGSFTATEPFAPALVKRKIQKQVVFPPSLRKPNWDATPPSAKTPLGSSPLCARNNFARGRNEGSVAKTVTWSSSAESDERSIPLVDEPRIPVGHSFVDKQNCLLFIFDPNLNLVSWILPAIPTGPPGVMEEVYRTRWP